MSGLPALRAGWTKARTSPGTFWLLLGVLQSVIRPCAGLRAAVFSIFDALGIRRAHAVGAEPAE
jgi:hypothetical protein